MKYTLERKADNFRDKFLNKPKGTKFCYPNGFGETLYIITVKGLECVCLDSGDKFSSNEISTVGIKYVEYTNIDLVEV